MNHFIFEWTCRCGALLHGSTSALDILCVTCGAVYSADGFLISSGAGVGWEVSGR